MSFLALLSEEALTAFALKNFGLSCIKAKLEFFKATTVEERDEYNNLYLQCRAKIEECKAFANAKNFEISLEIRTLIENCEMLG